MDNNNQFQQNNYQQNQNQDQFQQGQYQQPQYQQAQYQQAPYQQAPYQQFDPRFDYTPITMWGYFGYQILFSIPIVGFICVLIFAFSAHNINLRNFARSYFCFLIIVLVILGIVIASGAFAAVSYGLY